MYTFTCTCTHTFDIFIHVHLHVHLHVTNRYFYQAYQALSRYFDPGPPGAGSLLKFVTHFRLLNFNHIFIFFNIKEQQSSLTEFYLVAIQVF